MTTLNEARETIYGMFKTGLSSISLDRCNFENEFFDEPDAGSWIRVTLRVMNRVQSSLGDEGNRRFRTTAMLFVQVFTEVDTGIKTAEDLMKEVADIYEGKRVSGISFNAAEQMSSIAENKWKTNVVEIRFDFDEIR